MGRIIILVLVLLLLGAVALVGYAYSGLMQPDLQTVTQPVDLDVD
jgi:spore coat protein CotH